MLREHGRVMPLLASHSIMQTCSLLYLVCCDAGMPSLRPAMRLFSGKDAGRAGQSHAHVHQLNKIVQLCSLIMSVTQA